MQVEVNGPRLWFDVDGPALVPDGPRMRPRPTIIFVHGGPGGYDHSYFKPDFARLTELAQVVYLDLREHGRSGREGPAGWSFERCADDLRTFCDLLGVERPVILGHSMGGFVAMLYGIRHPGRAGGLVLSSTNARFDLERLVEGVRLRTDDAVAEIARRSYGGDAVGPEEWARAFVAFGPHRPDADVLERRIRNPDVGVAGMELLRRFDVVGALGSIDVPTLVCVGELDAVTPVEASEEIAAALAPGIGRLEVIEGAGHFAWLDDPDRYFGVVADFVAQSTQPTNAAAETARRMADSG
jgi:proline iminopeptidase